MKDFKNKKVLMTGVASGIGRSTAIAMGRLGAQLILTDRNEKGLQETVQLISNEGGKVSKYKTFDVSKYEDVKKFAEEVHRELGAMDIIMNIAGISIWGLIENLTHDHWQRQININLWGPIHIIECFLPETIRAGKGGHLLNVSSAAALTGFPWHVAYGASKWGLLGISEVLRYDLMHYNIGVTVVCPGAVETPLKQTVEIVGVDKSIKEFQEIQDRFTARAVTPEKVAELIVKAIKKNKFLVFTSSDIKALYWFKRRMFPVYHYIMKKLNNLLYKAKIAMEQKNRENQRTE